jgi:hypothetical protein
MILTQKIVSLAYALLLIACACFAGLEIFGFAFGIADGGGKIGPGIGILLIAALLGATALMIVAVGSWTRNRAVSLIALASALLVLPATVLFCWANGQALWHNTQIGYHSGPLAWASVLLPVPLDFVALLFSGLRFRQFSR